MVIIIGENQSLNVEMIFDSSKNVDKLNISSIFIVDTVFLGK